MNSVGNSSDWENKEFLIIGSKTNKTELKLFVKYFSINKKLTEKHHQQTFPQH